MYRRAACPRIERFQQPTRSAESERSCDDGGASIAPELRQNCAARIAPELRQNCARIAGEARGERGGWVARRRCVAAGGRAGGAPILAPWSSTKQEAVRLVEGERHHAVAAVVDVDVDIEHAGVDLEELEDREHDVVDVAEPLRLVLLRVVQPARPVRHDVGAALPQRGARQRAAGVRLAVLVEGSKLGQSSPMPNDSNAWRRDLRVLRRHLLQELHVVVRVERGGGLSRGLLRPEHVEVLVQPPRAVVEVVGEPDAVRPHRVVRRVDVVADLRWRGGRSEKNRCSGAIVK